MRAFRLDFARVDRQRKAARRDGVIDGVAHRNIAKNDAVYDAASFALINGVRTSVGSDAWLDVISTGSIYVTDDQNFITSFDANLAQTGQRSFPVVPGRTGIGRVSGDEQRAVVRLNGSGIVQLLFFSSTLPP